MTVATGERATTADALRAARDRLQHRATEAGFVQRQSYQLWRLCVEARDRLAASDPDWHRACRVVDVAYEDYRYAFGVADGLREARQSIAALIAEAIE